MNDAEGKKVLVNWKLKDINENTLHFFAADMTTMPANIGDPVYIANKRNRSGSSKSIHSRYGNIHIEDGMVYVTKENIIQGQSVSGKLLFAENEMC